MIVKTTQVSDFFWSAIFSVIVYYDPCFDVVEIFYKKRRNFSNIQKSDQGALQKTTAIHDYAKDGGPRVV